MKNLSFGFRFYILCGLSFLAAYLWAGSPSDDGLSEASVRFFQQVAGLAYLAAIGKMIKSRIRKIPFIAYILAGVFMAVHAGDIGLDVFHLLGSRISSDETRILVSSLVAPLLVAFVPPFFYYWLEWAKEQTLYRQFIEGAGGSARWGTLQSFLRHPAKLSQPLPSFPLAPDEGVTSPHIFMGRSLFRHDPFPRLVGISDDGHNITIASARSGKAVCSIFPVACTYLGDMVFIDPKGEHAKTTFHRRCSKDFLESQGIACEDVTKHFNHAESYVLDPFGITGLKSCYYNPLDEIDINDTNCREMIVAVVDGCILPESDKNKHFEETSKSVLQGLIAYVLKQFPDEPQKRTLPFVSDLLYGIDEEGFSDSARFDELLLDMLTCDAAGGLPQQAASELRKMGERERGAVLSTLSRGLKWIGDPAMRPHLAKSDFRFSEIGTKTTTDEDGKTHRVIQTVYIALPDTRMSDLSRWLRTLAATGTVAMRRRSQLPDLATLWVLDEFALLGNIKTISDGYGLFAGYKIKLWIFLQNLGQLKHDYPERWSAMMGNANVQFFGLTMTDPETPRFVSEALGRSMKVRTEGRGDLLGHFLDRKVVSETPRELLTASEVASLIGKSSNKQIVFPANDGFPLLLEKLAFKRLKVGGKWISGLPLDGLRGHFKNS